MVASVLPAIIILLAVILSGAGLAFLNALLFKDKPRVEEKQEEEFHCDLIDTHLFEDRLVQAGVMPRATATYEFKNRHRCDYCSLAVNAKIKEEKVLQAQDKAKYEREFFEAAVLESRKEVNHNIFAQDHAAGCNCHHCYIVNHTRS